MPLAEMIQEQAAIERQWDGRAPFKPEDAERAYDTWGCNCGPAALAAVLGITLDQIRPMMGDFEQKGHTTPTLVYEVLERARTWFRCIYRGDEPHEVLWPDRGLMRVQWSGPWTKPGVPIVARYKASHWVGLRSSDDRKEVFDCNALCAGGWLPYAEWRDELVPWLLREVHPKADGGWYPTHIIVVTPMRRK